MVLALVSPCVAPSPCDPPACQGRYHPAFAAHRASRPAGTCAQHEEEMAKGQTKQAQVQPALPTPTAHRPPPQAPCAPPTARLSSSRSSPPAAAALRALRALPEHLLCVPPVNDSASELPRRHQHLPSRSHAALHALSARAVRQRVTHLAHSALHRGRPLVWADAGYSWGCSPPGALMAVPRKERREL